MKKRSVIILLGIMIFSAVAASAQTTMSDWATEEVKTANEQNLIPEDFGISDYTQEIKRDKFCELAVQLIKIQNEAAMTESTENPFTDTDNESVIFLSEKGIIEGRGDGIFAPEDNIIREEAAAILYRMAEYMDMELPSAENVYYSDENDISDWAKNAVSSMKQIQVMNGTSDSTFSPKGIYTTEQAVATMVRMHKYAQKLAEPVAKRNALNEARRSHMSAAVGKKVYVIGGVNESGELVNNMEVCDGGANDWSYECTSDYITENAAVAVGGNTIYIIGGKKDNKAIDNVSAYDTETKEWREVGNIGTPVESAKAVFLDNKLYITLGEDSKDDHIIVYDIESDKASKLSYPKKLINAVPVVYDGKLYVFGSTETYVYNNGKWEEKSAVPEGYTLKTGQSDDDMIYFIGYEDDIFDSVLSYDTDGDSWKVIMDGYIKDKALYGFALCNSYAYITGGIDAITSQVNDSSEPYYYKWTYAKYDAANDFSFTKTIGLDFEPNGKSYDVIPKLLSVRVKVLNEGKGIYELSVPEEYYICDESVEPFFFWSAYSGCFDGNNTNYSRVIYHADGRDTTKIVVGMGDGSGWTDKKSFVLTGN